VTTGSDHQAGRVLTVVARCLQQSEQAPAAVAAVLATTHDEPTARTETAAHGRPGRTGDYELVLSLAAALAGRASDGLVAIEHDNTGYQRDLSTALAWLGVLARGAGDAPVARQLFERSLAIHEALGARDPDNTGYQHDLSTALAWLGDLAPAAGDAPGARELFERSLAIDQALVAREPVNTDYQVLSSVRVSRARPPHGAGPLRFADLCGTGTYWDVASARRGVGPPTTPDGAAGLRRATRAALAARHR
jgi:tetratricopeptide (TPR) repeat protein